MIDQQFILSDWRCDSVLVCAPPHPFSPVCFRFITRPLAPNLPTGPCELCSCQVASSQETNLYCQCPATTTNTPELGHAFYSSPRHTGLESALTAVQRCRRVRSYNRKTCFSNRDLEKTSGSIIHCDPTKVKKVPNPHSCHLSINACVSH